MQDQKLHAPVVHADTQMSRSGDEWYHCSCVGVTHQKNSFACPVSVNTTIMALIVDNIPTASNVLCQHNMCLVSFVSICMQAIGLHVQN